MRKYFLLLFVLAVSSNSPRESIGSRPLHKKEYSIVMRDGVNFSLPLFAADSSKEYPILMVRTPYTVSPYGADKYPPQLDPARSLPRRDSFLSFRMYGENLWVKASTTICGLYPVKKNKETDESTDLTTQSIGLLRTEHNNGNVGIWGFPTRDFTRQCR